MPPYLPVMGTTGVDDGRNSLDCSIGPQSAAGDGAPLVLPKPFPRDSRSKALRGVHRRISLKSAWAAKLADGDRFPPISGRSTRLYGKHAQNNSQRAIDRALIRETVVLFRDS
jgi:hypothetical protein